MDRLRRQEKELIGAGREKVRARESLRRHRGDGGRWERGLSKLQSELILPNLRGHAAGGRGADTHRGCSEAVTSRVGLLEEARDAKHERGLKGGRRGAREDGIALPRLALHTLLPPLDVSRTRALCTRVRANSNCSPGRPTPSECLKACEMSLLHDLESLFNQLQQVEAEDNMSARETVRGKA